jgi:hypothetical protein
MTDNKYLAVAAIIGTLSTCLLLVFGWDTDGFWLKQFTLVSAGFVARTVTHIIGLIEE